MKFALIIRRTLTVAAALVLAVVNTPGFARTKQERARPSEVVQVEGLHARVEIVRDRHGVPHVRAKNERDAHFGLGFVHAQDRLWQMEFQRRLGNGRLAEILGEKGLPTDRLFRTLGLHRTAAALGYNRARNWKEFNEATRAHRPADQNYVYADRHGQIGYIAAATIPVRPAGDDGRLPVPGWTGRHEWLGYVPFDELPRLHNPPQGYIATANNRVAGEGYPHLIGTNFAAPYRAARVVEMIESKKRHSPADAARMQSDVLALHAREVLPFMLKADPADDRGRQAAELLRGWDARVTGDSARAAVFEAWYLKLGERLFADELHDAVAGDALWRAYSENIYFVGMALEAALEEDAVWCDDVRTPAVETCADTLASSLTDGLAKMSEAQGTDDMTAWRWDRAHLVLEP